MFEVLRKYVSVLMPVLMGLVLACLISDVYGDAKQLSRQAAASACMMVVADDFDLDDDDDDDEAVTRIFVEDKANASVPMLETIGLKTEESKCSQDLLRRQVRRYSPRNNLPYGHNYAFLKNHKSGVDLFCATFLY